MDIRIIDTIGDVLFTVTFKDDRLAELAHRGVIFYVPRYINGQLYQIPMMKHTDLIDAINEMAL